MCYKGIIMAYLGPQCCELIQVQRVGDLLALPLQARLQCKDSISTIS
jgi:hypothetical protein